MSVKGMICAVGVMIGAVALACQVQAESMDVDTVNYGVKFGFSENNHRVRLIDYGRWRTRFNCDYSAYEWLSYSAQPEFGESQDVATFSMPTKIYQHWFDVKGKKNRLDPRDYTPAAFRFLKKSLPCSLQKSPAPYTARHFDNPLNPVKGADFVRLSAIDHRVVNDSYSLQVHAKNMIHVLPATRTLADGAWKATDDLVHCARKQGRVDTWLGPLFAAKYDTGNKHRTPTFDTFFRSSHGLKQTPRGFWKIVRFPNGEVNAWVLPNTNEATADRLDSYLTSIDNIQGALTIFAKDAGLRERVVVTSDFSAEERQHKPVTSYNCEAQSVAAKRDN